MSQHGATGQLAGRVAGYTNGHGYVVLNIRYRSEQYQIYGHRAGYAWLHGRWPKPGKRVDLRDGDPRNTSLLNLRCSSPSQNAANMKTRAGKATPKGVSFIRKTRKYVTTINHRGRSQYLGSYNTASDAAASYARAAAKLWGAYEIELASH